MCDKHWTDDELIARLYGVGPDNDHLSTCRSCFQRWESIRLKQEQLRAAETEVPTELLDSHRRAIRIRLGSPPKASRLRWVVVPSLAAGALLLAALVVFNPSAPKPPGTESLSEDTIIEDVFRMSQSSEPAAVEPVKSIFEESQ